MPSVSKLNRWFGGSAIAAAIMVAALCGLCLWGILWHRGIPADWGWWCEARGERVVVTVVAPNGPATGKLRPGDEIFSVNGTRRAAQFGPLHTLLAWPNSYSVDVLRDNEIKRFVLTRRPTPGLAWSLGVLLLIALINLGLAIWIGAARPDNSAARVAFFLFLAIAMTFAAAVLEGFQPPLNGVALGFAIVVSSSVWRPLGWALAYDFAMRFPEPVRQPRWLGITRRGLYGAGLVLCLAGMLPLVAEALGLSSRGALLPHWFPLAGFDYWHPVISDALGAIALCSVPFILARNDRKMPDDSSKSRLRWVALAITVSILPLAGGISLRFLLNLMGQEKSAEAVEPFLNTFASFAIVLVPLAVTYAIVKHRILGVRFVIRRGIQYLLAQNVLRVILYLPLIGIGTDLALHPREPLQDFLLNKSRWFYLFLAVTASLSLRYRTRMRAWVDKRFFRDAYEEEVILSDLIERLQSCESWEDIPREVAAQVEATLHPASMCVLVRNKSADTFTSSHAYESPLAVYFRTCFSLRLKNLLQSDRSPRTLAELAEATDDPLLNSNDQLRNTLVIPINGASEQLLGVLLLGDRKSEQAYSKRDRKLLQSMAAQIAVVVEMLELKEQVREEGRVRVNVLGRLDNEEIQLVLECPACGRCYTSPAVYCDADGSAVGMTLPIERVIEGKYRLERRIGAGGMGAVYEASDLRLDRLVAVKAMTGRLFGNNVALRRFEREARAVARLQHPNIVSIYDFGPVRGDGAYLVMQLLAGQSWRAELSAAGGVSSSRAAAWFDQLCDAMAYAHANGIVHRDLKPENVLVTKAGEGAEKITVVDFGLAKLQSLEHTAEPIVSTEDAVVGTYGYASPEQRAGERVDFRTDIYSIAVMVVETLTNSRPPRFGASDEWLDTVLTLAKPAPVLESMVRLLRRCLANSRNERLSDVSELQRDLIPLLRECSGLAFGKAVGSAGGDRFH